MFDIMTMNVNSNLPVASAMVKSLNKIASVIGEKSVEYAVTLATNARISSAFVKEMTMQTDADGKPYCTIDKYKTGDFVRYCEEKLGMSKSNTYAMVQVGSRMRSGEHVKGYTFDSWYTARFEMPVYEQKDGRIQCVALDVCKKLEPYYNKEFSLSALSILCRFDADVLVSLMRDCIVLPDTPVSKLRELVKEYKGAKCDSFGNIIKVEKENTATAETAETAETTETAETPETDFFEFELEIADGISRHVKIPASVLKKYIVE